MLPIPVLRFTHDCIDARMCFRHGAHAGDSVYELVDELWRGHLVAMGELGKTKHRGGTYWKAWYDGLDLSQIGSAVGNRTWSDEARSTLAGASGPAEVSGGTGFKRKMPPMDFLERGAVLHSCRDDRR